MVMPDDPTVQDIADRWIDFINTSKDKSKLAMMRRLYFLSSGCEFEESDIERVREFCKTLDDKKPDVKRVIEWIM